MSEQVCPYCGREIAPDVALPGSVPGTLRCPTCDQEIDAPLTLTQEVPPPPAGQPVAPEPGAWAPPPPPETAPSCDGLAGLADQLAAPAPAQPFMAWEGEGNFFARLWLTCWQVLLHPVRTLARPARPGHAWPVSFAVIMGTLAAGLTLFWERLLDEVQGAHPLVTLALSPLGTLLGVYVLAAIYHAFLWVVRGHRQGFTATLRATAYSNAGGIFYFVPVVGPVVGGVWLMVAVIGGLAGAQKISVGRAFSAALLLPLAALLLLGAAILAMVIASGGLDQLERVFRQGMFS